MLRVFRMLERADMRADDDDDGPADEGKRRRRGANRVDNCELTYIMLESRFCVGVALF